MKILIVSYNWPPRNAMGTRRPVGWARVWSSLGAEVSVLTADKYDFDSPLDYDLAEDELSGVRVISVPYLNRGKLADSSTGHKKKMIVWLIRVLKSIRRFLARSFGLNLDIRNRWVKYACVAAQRELDLSNFEAVVSTYGPESSHLIASKIRKNYPDILWIADFRDLWFGNPTSKGALDSLIRKVEKRVCARADLLTTVSEGFASELRRIHEKRVEVFTNGYDDSFKAVVARIEQRDKAAKKGPMPSRIVYTGNLYPDIQDPRPIFRAAMQLIEAGELRPDSIRFEFYGSRLTGITQAARECGAVDVVRVNEAVSRTEALHLQREASALLLLEVTVSRSGGVLPGKVFEYLASGTPVICVGNRSDRELETILTSTGTGQSFGSDTNLLKDVVLSLRDRRCPEWYSPDLFEVERYSRTYLSEKMYASVQQLVNLRR